MGLVIGGVINSPPEPTRVNPEPQPVKPTKAAVNSLAELRKNIVSNEPEQTMTRRTKNVVKSEPRVQFDPNDHLVVVEGKAKKIGKQSKYLLDMLTIEE